LATTNHRKERPGRTLLGLLIIAVVLFGAIGAGTAWGKATWAPKLALDLEGGTQIILTPTTTDGSKVTSDTINESINVIRQRVDGAGVSDAQISSLNNKDIVVAIPGKASQETIDSISKAAQMRIRPVLVIGSPLTAAQQTAAATTAPTAPSTTAPTPAPTAPKTASSGGKAGNSAFRGESPHSANAVGAAYTRTVAATPAPSPAVPAPAATPAPTGSSSGSDDGLSSLDQVTPAIQKQYDNLDCTNEKNLAGGGGDDPKKPLVTCQDDGSAKYILGPVEIEGTEIASASSGLETTSQGVTTNNWVVNIKFTGTGAKEQTAMTKRIAGLESPRNQFGMVLDDLVISAPSVDSQYASTGITGNQSQISGNFTRQSAATLANQLNFGSLPLTFDVQSQSQISATLGSEQLQRGLLAGLIGLVLVVIYSFFQYRVLGLLTVASLAVAALLTYGAIALFSWTYGYRLSLPGVAGLIVAIGFTADSFIVYFERIRDELRDGRGLAGAVERGWARARRTILASDAVNFLAAAVLYFLAVGGVQGFAFTLGLTTLVDLVVVFLFTHPMMQVLSGVPYFREGRRFSGLEQNRLAVKGVRYQGRGRVGTPGVEPPPDDEAAAEAAATAPAGPDTDASDDDLVLAGAPSSEEASSPRTGGRRPVATTSDGRRMTIAERRAAERAAQQAGESSPEQQTGQADGDSSDGDDEENR
jgi:preprotein translocase subunit SecD